MSAVRRVGVVVVSALVAGGLSATFTGPVAAAAQAAEPEVAPTTPYQVPADMESESDHSDPAWLDPDLVVPKETTVEVDVPVSGWVRAGSSPVSIAAPEVGTAAQRVRVRVLSQAEVASAGGQLLGFEVSRVDGASSNGYVAVSVDYTGIAKAFGGNFGSRLRLVRATRCPADAPCSQASVAGRNEVPSRRLRAMSVAARPQVPAGPAPGSGFGPQVGDQDTTALLDAASTTYVMAASSSGAAGDFSASDVSPADRWDVGLGSGGFTYSYPVVVPPAVGGPAPSLSFDYSSQSVDGRTLAANGQAPKTGEGWHFEPGFIERKFATCPSGDNAGEKCWSADNEYFLHFGGRTGEIVRDPSGEWRLRSDSAWKILERTGGPNADNNGEYFVLITPDGTKHWFGLGAESTVVGAATTNSVQEVPVYGDSGEPCYNAVASAAWCQQAYRWNLDRIVDPNNNSTTFFYAKETNRYARWSTSTSLVTYARSSYLTRVEYGQRAGSETSESPWARVLVTVADRCVAQANCPEPVPANASAYPDVPLDLLCPAPGQVTCSTELDTPTFWSTKQIERVQTEFRNVEPDPDVWEAVSTYDLNYSFPSTDDGTDPSLWLTDVTRTGVYGTGSVALPGLRLNGVRLQNRVNTGAGVPALNKWRVGYVSTDLNARLVVTYGIPHPCPTTPSFPTNATDCYPAWYEPQDGTTPGWVLFYKYLVTRVVTEDNRGNQPSQTVNYTYNDTPAWHYADSLLAPLGTQSWSDYRGHSSVDVSVQGDSTNEGTTTRYELFRGMHGDKLTSTTSKTVTLTDSTGATFTDHHYLAGLPLMAKRLTASGFAFEETLHRYWVQQTVNGPDGWQSHDAQYVRESTTVERTKNLTTSAWRDRTVTMEYVGATGVLRQISDGGDPDVVGDGTCTIHGYAYTDTAWIISKPYRTDTYAGGCSTVSPTKIAETDYYYDDQAFQTAPVKGNASATWAYSGAGVKSVTNFGYDAYGRTTSVVSPDEVANGTNGPTVTSYAPSTGYPYSGITTTNVLGHVSKTVLYSAFGTPRRITDANNQTTVVNVDNLGRTTWVARPDDTSGTPSTKYTYVIGAGTPNRVITEQLLSGTTYVKTYDYLDGLGRAVQTQLPAADGTTTTTRRLVVTRYDAAGGIAAVSQPFAASGAPGSDLAVVSPAAVPFDTRTWYDYAGRAKQSSQYAAGFEKSTTTTVYKGWSHTVDHPVRSNVDHHTDVYGRTTALVEYPSGGAVTTLYDYTRLGDLERITVDRPAPANDVVTHYEYDWLRRRTLSTDPDQGTWRTYYTASGDVDHATDANVTNGTNNALHYKYDRLRRKIEVWADAVTSGTLLARWRYDNAPTGEPTISNAIGRPTRASSFSGGAEYTTGVTAYDARGRVIDKKWVIPSSAGTVAGTYNYTYGYNADDSLRSVALPLVGSLAAETVTTGFNNAGLPTSLSTSLSGGPYVSATTYQTDGRIATRSLVGSVQRTYGYDSTAGRLRTVQATAPLASNGGATGTIEDVIYGYDAENNVTSITDFIAGEGGVAQRECFKYDPLNRLTDAFTTNTTCGTPGAVPLVFGADPYDRRYAYDELGNITQAYVGAAQTIYDYVGSGHTHAPLKIGNQTYGYDNNGATILRPTASGNQNLTWNRLHQLASISGPGASTFVYDAEGARLLRSTGGTTTLYLDGMEVSGPSDGSGTKSATRYYGGFAMRNASGVTVLLRNRQNSTSIAYNPALYTALYQRYTPFGTKRGMALVVTDHRFLNEPEDASGLIAMGARYYDPGIGRFISVDPLADVGQPQSLAGYSYSLNNPATLSDPSGLSPGCTDEELDCDARQDAYIERTKRTSVRERQHEMRRKRYADAVLNRAYKHADYERTVAEQMVLCSVYYWHCEAFTGNAEHDWVTQAAIETVLTAGAGGPIKSGARGLAGLVFRGGARGAASAAEAAGAEAVAETTIARAARLGREGEDFVGIVGPKEAIASLTETAARRFPDQLGRAERVLLEVKNVERLGWTNQLRDFAAYAVENNLDYQIITRTTTVVDPGLEGFMREAGFTIAKVL